MDCQKDFSKNVNGLRSGLMPYSVGFAAGLSLGFDLDMGNCVHKPVGVREALYPEMALYLYLTLYLCKAPSGAREKPAAVYLDRAVYGSVSV